MCENIQLKLLLMLFFKILGGKRMFNFIKKQKRKIIIAIISITMIITFMPFFH